MAVRTLLLSLETKFKAPFILRLILSSRENDGFAVP